MTERWRQFSATGSVSFLRIPKLFGLQSGTCYNASQKSSDRLKKETKMRFFNTAGPVQPEKHYNLDPLHRFNLPEILSLIEQEKYFILHAPRQTGKTSALLALMKHLNEGSQYQALYFNVEIAQAAREDVPAAMQAILSELSSRADIMLQDPVPRQIKQTALQQEGGNVSLNYLLTAWSEASEKPLILLIDEIDSLIGDTLISVLRQLRAGYDKRPAFFPQSVVLCGVRDVRDYRIHSSQSQEIITGGSAFNVKAKSLTLGNFNQKEVAKLYQQHTEETGQVFAEGVLEAVWHLTRGQPWLVNALGYEVCFEMEAGRERSQPITAAMIIEAKERLILRRETHLDQLADKLQEPRVQRVIKPMLQGTDIDQTVPLDDIEYVLDLGLVSRNEQKLEIANAIYREVIPRQLTYIMQINLASRQEASWYIGDDGRLMMEKLLTAFQQFFREHSESWVERFDYKEAGPQLLLQAFLQRIINGGGRLEREYGLGRGRTDLLVIWPYPAGEQRVVLELKIKHRSLEETIAQGLEQTWRYFDQSNAEAAHLIIFNRDENIAWAEKIFRREAEFEGVPIVVWGM